MDQYEFIHKYIDNHIDKFNSDLFRRSDEAIIDQVEKIIMSCQTNGIFSIQVKGFTVINDYIKIQETLRNYYDASRRTSRSTKRGEDDNRYNYIDLKDSDLKLLVVHYHIKVKDEEADCDVLIEIPRIVNKFYFYINGNYYSPMYQIVDASTYNNMSAKNQKTHSVTFKTNKNPIRIYKHDYPVYDTNDECHVLTQYDCNVFSKTVPTIMYLFAKYGLTNALDILQLSSYIYIGYENLADENHYSFNSAQMKYSGNREKYIYITIPKIFIDRNPVVQHILYTILTSIDNDCIVQDLYTKAFWTTKLGGRFSSANKLEKGYSVLESMEGILDINIQEQLHLPWEYKKDIYRVLLWMICEYGLLRLKDNKDIYTKKLRCAEYIAAIYGNKLSTGIYRLCSIGKRVDIRAVKKVIYTKPDYIISEVSKSQLVNFRNIVNDMDSVLATKFTYKGISGIGNNSKSFPEQMRLLNISTMGILDPDASSASDPGASGSLVPFAHINNNGYFSAADEPLTWYTELGKLSDEYTKTRGLVEAMEFKRNVLGNETSQDDMAVAKQSEKIVENINKSLSEIVESNDQVLKKHVDSLTGYSLEGSGLIYYE